MTAKELRKKYLNFFVKKGHKIIPSAPLVPEHDPTVLFTTAGMHPLVPYLLGEAHPLGKRLCSVQKCLRTDDIESVGDTYHHTFFEMLGNWSLGDYWKKEAIEWSYEFLTSELSLDPGRLYISCFSGDSDAPKDEESAKIWQEVGIVAEKIYFYGKKENWWGPAGKTGPCGPDTEMFYDVTGRPCSPSCHPNDNCGRFFEIWNDVFMQYNKKPDGTFEPLIQKNVDTGMGVERTVAVLSGLDDNYETELFTPIIHIIEVISGKKYEGDFKKNFRIVADHLKAAAFLIADGVEPSNVERGYILRRLIRRAIRYGRLLKINTQFTSPIAERVIETYGDVYPELAENRKKINEVLLTEEEKFKRTLDQGLKEFDKFVSENAYIDTKLVPGDRAFYLYESFGFPPELTCELARERGYKVDVEGFDRALIKHQELSRKGAQEKFAGGLADHSEEVTKLHTTTHLLHQALRTVLGEHVCQSGSNITSERLRFDFSHPQKLTDDEIKKVEDLVNQKIKENLLVSMEIVEPEAAKKIGALGFFEEKYGEKVKVYLIGDFSKEVCGGPHVNFTRQLGRFKIIKEEAASSGVRRIYAVLVSD